MRNALVWPVPLVYGLEAVKSLSCQNKPLKQSQFPATNHFHPLHKLPCKQKIPRAKTRGIFIITFYFLLNNDLQLHGTEFSFPHFELPGRGVSAWFIGRPHFNEDINIIAGADRCIHIVGSDLVEFCAAAIAIVSTVNTPGFFANISNLPTCLKIDPGRKTGFIRRALRQNTASIRV